MALKPFNSIGGFSVGETRNTVIDSNLNITSANITANGNISGTYILGNISLATGAYSNSNVSSYLASNPSFNIVLTGNITGSNFIGNGQYLSSIAGANVTGVVAQATQSQNANVASVANVAYSVDAGNVVGTVAQATQAQNANVATLAYGVSGSNVTGTVAQATQAQNANVASVANVAYSVDAGNVVGTVAQATQAQNANVATLAYGVSGSNVTGTVAQATQAQNANVAGVANVAYSVDAGNVVGTVAQATQANTANVATLAYGVSGSNVTGTVAQATQAQNANVASVANVAYSVDGGNVVGQVGSAAFASSANVANTAFAVSGSNVSGAVALATNAGVANIANVAYSVAAANVTGLTSAIDTEIGAYTGNISPNNITATGNIGGNVISASGGLSVTGNATISGNLSVGGNISYINVQDLNVQDPLISLGGGPNGAPLTTDDGMDRGVLLQYYKGSALTAWMGWNDANSYFELASSVTVANNVATVNSLGNVLLNTVTGNIVGTFANVGNASIGAGGLTVAGNANVTGNISGGNLSLTGSFNIGGALVSNNISANGNVTAGQNMSFSNVGLLTGGTANVVTVQTQNVNMSGLYGATAEALSGNITNSNVAPTTIFTGFTYTNSDYQLVIRGRDTNTNDTFITNMTLMPNGDYILYNDMGNSLLGALSVSVNGNTSQVIVNVVATSSNTTTWNVDAKSFFG